MKIMDSSTQDDECYIEAVTPPKKKKLKQARLPFQMLSSVESPNSISNKKRKLSSPSIEYKSPKVLKITSKENSLEDVAEDKMESTSNSANESDGSLKVIEDDRIDDTQERSESDTADNRRRNVTPKRSFVGKVRELHNKKKSSALAKFFKKSDQKSETGEDVPDMTNDKNKVEGNNEVLEDQPVEYISQSPDSTKDEKKDIISLEENSSHVSECESTTISSEEDDKKSDNDESNLDESLRNDSPSVLKNTGSAKSLNVDKTMNDIKQKKLTPKQQERQLQIAKRKEERQRLRMEKEKKLEEERESRRREKEEKRKAKEEKERAEREQRIKEKQMKEMKKQMELEQKQKEKEAKEEERRKREEAKEEEKRKKEEEKLEADRKKQKAASNFASFFVAKKQETKSFEEENIVETKNFMPFEIKAGMKVAPILRRTFSQTEKHTLDEMCASGNAQKTDLYLCEIKTKKIVPRGSGRTWPVSANNDVILIDEENDGSSNIVDRLDTVEKHRPKLLQFHENRRPPYWGTWRKRSKSVNPRKPFALDQEWFNYEVDSEEEWEEEEEGESLRGSDDEKDEENPEENEYDIDNEFMVPHGYLSDEEVQMDEKETEVMTPESRKLKLKVLGEQFETQRNAKTWQLKPKIIGCVWQGPENKFSESILPRTVEFLLARQIWVNEIPVVLPDPVENEISGECHTPTQATHSSKKTKVPKDALPDLIRLVHGNIHSRDFLVKEFIAYWMKRNKVGKNQISKASLQQKIREIARHLACPDEGPMHLKVCWYVPEETRKEYLPEGEELTMPNRWSYNLTPKRKSDVADIAEKPDKEEKEREKEKEKKNVPLITQFMKKISQEGMKKQQATKPAEVSASSTSHETAVQKPPLQRPPKRATLISVARGQQFPQTSRESLFKNLNTEKSNTSSSNADYQNSDSDVTLVKPDESDKWNKSVETKDETKCCQTALPVETENKRKHKSNDSFKYETPKADTKKTRNTGDLESPMEIDASEK